MPKLSIIVPVYNVEKYLSRCIDSILDQKFQDFELILIDDGSIDASGTICDEYKKNDKRIVVIHKPNGGSLSARKVGIKQSSGNYISFVDSDDWIEIDSYSKFIQIMNNELEIDICVGGMVRNFQDGSEKIICNEMPDRLMTNIEAIQEMFQWKIFRWELCGKLYRRTLFHGFNIRDDIVICEDLASNWFLFKKAKKIWYSSLPKYHYYLNEESLTENRLEENRLEKNNEWIVFKEIWYSGEIKDRFIREKVCGRYINNLLCNIRTMLFYNANRDEDEEKIKCFQNNIKNIINDVSPSELYTYVDKILLEDLTADYIVCKHKYENGIKKIINDIMKVSTIYMNVYIYGTGTVAKYLSNLLRQRGIKYSAHVISDGQIMRKKFAGRPVFYLSQLDINNKDNCFILALNKKNEKIVGEGLQRIGHYNICKLDLSFLNFK
jgi:glycosyltransferase involved in cell wall biosynthesis